MQNFQTNFAAVRGSGVPGRCRKLLASSSGRFVIVIVRLEQDRIAAPKSIANLYRRLSVV